MYYTKLSSKLSENIFGILIQFPADSVIFTEEILNGKLHFLCGEKKSFLKKALLYFFDRVLTTSLL